MEASSKAFWTMIVIVLIAAGLGASCNKDDDHRVQRPTHTPYTYSEEREKYDYVYHDKGYEVYYYLDGRLEWIKSYEYACGCYR